MDIIKSGGFKISALEVEDALMPHGAGGGVTGGITDCAVFGIPDDVYGEVVVAVVVHPSGPVCVELFRVCLGSA